MENIELIREKDLEIDVLQEALGQFEPVNCPLKHLFTKGLYCRSIWMPAFTTNSSGETVQTVIVSKIHKTQHIFNISWGSVSVYNGADDFIGTLEAPYLGITIPQTRRVLVIISDCCWTTFHPLDYITGDENNWSERRKRTLIERIENDIIMKRDVNLIGKDGEV